MSRRWALATTKKQAVDGQPIVNRAVLARTACLERILREMGAPLDVTQRGELWLGREQRLVSGGAFLHVCLDEKHPGRGE